VIIVDSLPLCPLDATASGYRVVAINRPNRGAPRLSRAKIPDRAITVADQVFTIEESALDRHNTESARRVINDLHHGLIDLCLR
jgi:hypothetical protein